MFIILLTSVPCGEDTWRGGSNRHETERESKSDDDERTTHTRERSL